jgi:hypothetical protein
MESKPMDLREFISKLDDVMEKHAFPAVDLLYKNSYLTEREAEELKIRRPTRAELNGTLCAHYTSIEGRTVYFRSLGDALRFVFLRADGHADFYLEVSNDTKVISLKQY